MAGDVPAVTAAVRILERLAKAWPDAVAPGTLVRELGLNRSTCYNIVGTLQQAGWVAGLDGRPGWMLGPRLLVITGVTDKARLELEQEEIEALSASLNFVVFLAAREPGIGFRVLAVAERGTGVRVTVSVGDTFPFSAPALMQASLAWLDPDVAERLLDAQEVIAFTERTVTDRHALRCAFERVRTVGHAESIQQYNMAQSGVAAPIFDAGGAVRHVVCSLAFSSELNDGNVAEVGAAVRRCADTITRRTGGILPTRAEAAIT
jgi:IclR family acetate operon transcriptional repressor